MQKTSLALDKTCQMDDVKPVLFTLTYGEDLINNSEEVLEPTCMLSKAVSEISAMRFSTLM